MEKLPVETLLQIFQLACADGGYTGCSLSQISRAVRATSQPVRFHSVALSVDFDQLESFLTSYRKLGSLEDGSRRAKIIHLHLQDDEEDIGPTTDDFEEDHFLASSYSQAVKLLHLVSDDLVSLVLPSLLITPISPSIDGVRLTDHPFPSLQALIVNAPIDTSASVLRHPAMTPLFPALTHAHIVLSPRASDLLPFSVWYTHAPRCTHLRVSFVNYSTSDYSACSTMETTRHLLGTPTYPHRMGRRPIVRPPPAARDWPSVRHVAIQPVPEDDTKFYPCGNMMQMYWNMRSELSWMVEWADNEKIFESARVLESRSAGVTRSSREWRAVVREAWEKVVSSGVDCDWLTLGEEEEKLEEDES